MAEEKPKEKPKQAFYQASNFEASVISQNNMIIKQLTEMNYYMAVLAKQDKEMPEFMEKDNG